MEILHFFTPVDHSKFRNHPVFHEDSFYQSIMFYDGLNEDFEDRKIAVIGIKKPNEDNEIGYEVRNYLYRLKRKENAAEVVDFGDFTMDYQQKSFESLGFTLSEIIANNMTPVIINGMQELTYAQYLCFAYLRQYTNLAVFDSNIDFDLQEQNFISTDNYLQAMLIAEPNYLFNLSILGYQGHFVDFSNTDFLGKLNFDLIRLGDLRKNSIEIEPYLRSAHLASWDLAIVRQSDAPGAFNPSPNGLHGEEACQLSRYAGQGSNMRSIGFYNYGSESDNNGQTTHLVAQMIWYFIEGHLNRYAESPNENIEDFLKYISHLNNHEYQIVFYKSKRTDRWWMEVPIVDQETENNVKFYLPCSYEDYLQASQDVIPDRWLSALRKLS
ncbi:MAG: arginase family protein [Bacteroidota bacterium]|nr:arginase family protein [Bacteroidota bacterium]